MTPEGEEVLHEICHSEEEVIRAYEPVPTVPAPRVLGPGERMLPGVSYSVPLRAAPK